MAQNGNSIMTFLLAITMVSIMIFFSSAAMAQDIAMAPTPPMETGLDTGDGFGLPVSEALKMQEKYSAVTVEDDPISAATVVRSRREIALALADENPSTVDNAEVHLEMFHTSIDTNLLLVGNDSVLEDQYSGHVDHMFDKLPESAYDTGSSMEDHVFDKLPWSIAEDHTTGHGALQCDTYTIFLESRCKELLQHKEMGNSWIHGSACWTGLTLWLDVRNSFSFLKSNLEDKVLIEEREYCCEPSWIHKPV